MERFFSRITVLMVVIVVAGIIAVPIVAGLVFSDAVSERWRFDRWPVWLQVPFGIIVGLYFVVEFWCLIRPSGKRSREQGRSTVRNYDGKPPA